jgi:hypothetical protein
MMGFDDTVDSHSEEYGDDFRDVATYSPVETDRRFSGAVRWFYHTGISSRSSSIYPNGT